MGKDSNNTIYLRGYYIETLDKLYANRKTNSKKYLYKWFTKNENMSWFRILIDRICLNYYLDSFTFDVNEYFKYNSLNIKDFKIGDVLYLFFEEELLNENFLFQDIQYFLEEFKEDNYRYISVINNFLKLYNSELDDLESFRENLILLKETLNTF